MAIIRSKIARQLLAEGGAPRKGYVTGGDIEDDVAQMEMDMGISGGPSPSEYSGMDQESQAEVDQARFDAGFRTPDYISMGVSDDATDRGFFRRGIDALGAGLQNRRGQNIMNFLGRSTAPTMRGKLGLGKPGDINYVLDLLQNPDDRVYGLSNKEREIGEKLISAGIRDEFDIRNMTQSQFDALFPGPPKGEGGDSEPIKKLRAPITEKKEEPKSEFDDILKFYGARFARGGSTGFEGSPELGGQGTQTEETYGGPPGGDGGDDEPPMIQPDTGPRGSGPLGMPTFQNLQTHFANNAKLEEAVRMGLITNEEYNVLGGYDARQTLGLGPLDTGIASAVYNVAQSLGKGRGNQPFSEIPGDVMRNVRGASTKGISPELQGKYESIVGPGAGMMTLLEPYGGPRRFQADGGEVRQEYFGGGITDTLKKGIGAVKKIVKSPIGKAALIGGLGFLGSKTGFGGELLTKFKNLSALQKALLLGGTALTLSPFATEEEEEKLPTVANTDPDMVRTLEFYGGPRRFAAEGGMMEQDEMLDLGGKEMDLRGGGFVPLGEYEKKDDVPARLSKNEFVFTADAVRAAGGGSVDKGADVMYKTMKTLENKVA